MNLKERLAAIPGVGTVMAVQKRTKADAADQFGAALAFHGFISVFPLIAVAVAVAGWLLADQPEQLDNVIEAIQTAVPGLQTDAIDGVINSIIDNVGSIGVIGFLGALYTGLRVTNAAQTATQFVFGVRLEEVSAAKARAQQLGSLVVLGILAISGVAVSAWVQSVVLSNIGGAEITAFGAWVISALLDVLLFWTAYRMYSAGSGLGWRDLLPGALFGGTGWAALKYFGGAYLASQAESSVVTSGDRSSTAALLLGTMIGLLLLFYLAGRLYVYGAELSAVLAGVGSRADEDVVPQAGEVDDDVDEGPTERTSGNRDGLLAALTAHERRRGLSSPADADDPDDPDGVFTDGSQGSDDRQDTDAADRQGVMASTMVTAGGAGTHDEVDGDVVVAIGHQPEARQHPDLEGVDGGVDDVPSMSDVTTGAATSVTTSADTGAIRGVEPTSPMTRALVPLSATPSRGMSIALTEDPVARRVAAAAAVGLVGLAVGVWRGRRRG